MRKAILTIVILSGTLLLFMASCNSNETKKETPEAGISNDSLVKRGAYLVNAIGCDDCHTPKKFGPNGPEPDMDKRFAGYPADRPFPKVDSNLIKSGVAVFTGDLLAAAGPWGVSFAANISGDETGIGNWNVDQFKKAIRDGKWKGLDGSRSLLPPMPWPTYRNLNDDDLASIFAYLKTSKPQKNIVPSPKQLSDL